MSVMHFQLAPHPVEAAQVASELTPRPVQAAQAVSVQAPRVVSVATAAEPAAAAARWFAERPPALAAAAVGPPPSFTSACGSSWLETALFSSRACLDVLVRVRPRPHGGFRGPTVLCRARGGCALAFGALASIESQSTSSSVKLTQSQLSSRCSEKLHFLKKKYNSIHLAKMVGLLSPTIQRSVRLF